MVAFVPLPIFLDLRSLTILLERNFIIEDGKIPFPLGGVTFAAAMAASYLFSILYKTEYKTLLTPRAMGYFVFFSIIPFVIYTNLVSGLSMVRVAQLILPILAFSIISIPQKENTQKLFALSFFLGGGVFYVVHFSSLLLVSQDIFSINYIDFSFVYDYLIYQSLVTYPGVLSIYFFCGLALLLSFRYGLMPKLTLLFILIIVLVLLLMASRRASLIEVGGGFFILIFGSLVFSVLRNKVRILSIITIIAALFISPFLYGVIINSPLYERAINSYSAGTFDSGRLDIYDAALTYFFANIKVLMIGAGGDSAVGFHNFFLDTIYRIGLIGLLLYAIMFFYLFRKFRKFIQIDSAQKYTKKILLMVIAYLLLIQTFVNTSITQPYYALNFLMALIMMVFYIFSERKALALNYSGFHQSGKSI
ncbi:hypothetical protein H0A65_16475 [Alcaligenaceae bacterium]|nr:hypothetical protein [Alcaligenaceae bacterium]